MPRAHRSRSLRGRLWRRPVGNAERGQSLVEFALGLPLLLLIMLGTLDIGQVFIDYVTMRNAVREAASYGARNPADVGGMRDRYTMHSPLLADAGANIATPICYDRAGNTPACGSLRPDVEDGARIELTASRVYTPIMTGFLQDYFGLSPFVLEARATAEVLK